MRLRPRARLALLALALCLPGCGSEPDAALGAPRCDEIEPTGPAKRIRAVVIVNDTMRPDRVGAYGGPVRTPTFDAFAASNLLFENATSQAPWTKPAIATLFTALHPSQHGVLDHPVRRAEAALHDLDAQEPPTDPATADAPELETDVLGQQFRTLAEVMRLAGVRTAAFVSNPWLVRGFGFEQGFEVYDDSFARWDAPGADVSRAGLDWLATLAADDPFLLYLHYVDSHLPYGALDEATLRAAAPRIEADRRRVTPEARRYLDRMTLADGRPLLDATEPSLTLLDLAYDRGIEAFDRALAVFLEGFAGHPAHDRTAIVVTSDHGESLFERGYGNHGRSLFETELAIPMAVRLPGTRAAQSRSGCPVGLVDVLPTLCDYFEIPCADEMAGRSFLAPEQPGAPRERRYVVSEGLPDHASHRAIRNRRYKLLFEPDGRLIPRGAPDPGIGPSRPWSLYDLVADPREEHDLLANGSRDARRIAEVMSRALVRAVPDAAPEPARAPLDPALQKRLESLGYLESD